MTWIHVGGCDALHENHGTVDLADHAAHELGGRAVCQREIAARLIGHDQRTRRNGRRARRAGGPEVQQEQGRYPRRCDRGAEVQRFHGRTSYRINSCGCTALEPRHHHAARTRRQRRYAGSGKVNVMAVVMARFPLHSACHTTSGCTSRAK